MIVIWAISLFKVYGGVGGWGGQKQDLYKV